MTKAITTHVPTRWAVLALVGESILRSRLALIELVTRRKYKFEELLQSAPTAVALKPCRDNDWWDKVTAAMELLRPFADAIAQLEADRPYLSQMATVWSSLKDVSKKCGGSWGMDMNYNCSLMMNDDDIEI